MLLEIQGLSVRYGRIRAVREASVNVAEGEIVAVLGANGAGKSSLLKAALGLVALDSGGIKFAGADATRWSTAQRLEKGMVLVPEGRRIVMSLSVDENLLMGAYARRDADAVRREIGAVYERFPNLGERRHMSASVLSGGEQQMLAIGRGALARPRLMMLDEPSLGLSHLVEINRAGVALLLVEQNTRKALGIAARAYVMELGNVVMSGTPQELLSDNRLEAAYLGTGGKT